MTKPVLVLGGTGMIGHGVVLELIAAGIPFRATTRHEAVVPTGLSDRFTNFDSSIDILPELLDGYGRGDVVVNCAGLIKQYIDDLAVDDRVRALESNAALALRLALLAREQGFRVIHITSDCVFAGTRGNYLETDPHDATDVYGQSKSLGEIATPGILTIRCSVIGPELRGFRSLMHWVLSHNDGAQITGFTNHQWNGVTSTAFGRVVAGVIRTGNPLSGTVHLVPANSLSKFELVRTILDAFDRTGITLTPVATENGVDRVLGTAHPDINARMWKDAGYAAPPTVSEMIADLARTRTSNGD
jgi:dTDP-4-dehydrorhamnose reductase